MSPRISPIGQEAGMSLDQVVGHRLTLASRYLGWAPRRIAAFRQGFAAGRRNDLDIVRLGLHSFDDGFDETKLTARLVDSLGYRDGAQAAEAFVKDIVEYPDSHAVMRDACYWADNGDNDFEVDDAEWTHDPTDDLAVFLRVRSHRKWIEWFVAEHKAAIDDGRSGYADLLMQDIREPIVYVDYSGERIDVWDGHHRLGAAMLKGSDRIPAIKGIPAALVPTRKFG